MDLIELRGERAKRQRSRRRRSALIALVCGAAMLGLTAGVFTVASTSRRMAEQSTRVHVLDEVLTATTIIRAQLGFGLVLTDLNGFSDVDASEAIETSLADVDSSLDSVRRSRQTLTESLGGLSAEAVAALDEFEQVTTETLDSAGRDDPLATTTQLNRTYREATSVLVAERDIAIDAVEEADRELGRLSTLVSFLTAFVIPTLAIIIYRLLSAPQRELLEAEARVSRDVSVGEIRRSLLLNRLQLLYDEASEQPPADGEPPGRPDLAGRIDAIRRTVLTLERAQRCRFGPVSLGEVAAKAIATAGQGLTSNAVGDTAAIVQSDREVLELLLGSIIADCRQRQATTVDFETESDGDTILLRVRHDGLLRSPAECNTITTQATVSDRLALLAGPDVDIVTALHLAEDLQGRLDLKRTSHTEQVLTLRLPAEPLAAERRPRRLAEIARR